MSKALKSNEHDVHLPEKQQDAAVVAPVGGSATGASKPKRAARATVAAPLDAKVQPGAVTGDPDLPAAAAANGAAATASCTAAPPSQNAEALPAGGASPQQDDAFPSSRALSPAITAGPGSPAPPNAVPTLLALGGASEEVPLPAAGDSAVGGGGEKRGGSVIRDSYLVSDASRDNPVYRLIRRKELQRKYSRPGISAARVVSSGLAAPAAAPAPPSGDGVGVGNGGNGVAAGADGRSTSSGAASSMGPPDQSEKAAGSMQWLAAVSGASSTSSSSTAAASSSARGARSAATAGSPARAPPAPLPQGVRSVIDEGDLVGEDAKSNPVYRLIRRTELERRYNMPPRAAQPPPAVPSTAAGVVMGTVATGAPNAASNAAEARAPASLSQTFALGSERSKLNEVYRLIRRKELERRYAGGCSSFALCHEFRIIAHCDC